MLDLICTQTLYTTTTVETVTSWEVEVHLFRWGPNFLEGVHLFQPLSEQLVPGVPVLGGSIFVVTGQRLLSTCLLWHFAHMHSTQVQSGLKLALGLGTCSHPVSYYLQVL